MFNFNGVGNTIHTEKGKPKILVTTKTGNIYVNVS